MVAIQPTSSDQVWLYELVPSTALPTVDLSQSLKSRYLPPTVLHAVDSFLRRWKYSLAIAYALALALSPVILYAEAPAGRIIAMLTLVLGLPLGLGGLGALRFEMVQLLAQEDSVVFFSILNAVTQVLTGILLGDTRALYLANVSLGFVNAVFIDARLRAVRWFTHLCSVAVLMVAVSLAALVQDHVDQVHDITLWKYQEGATLYNVRVSEYVTTGIFTLMILMAKIVYHKLQSMRGASRITVIECVVFQCKIKLVACSRHSPSASNNAAQNNLDPASPVQQLRLVHSGRVYDARKTVMSAVMMATTRPFPWYFLVILYGTGLVGFILLFTSSFYGTTSKSHQSTVYDASIACITFSASLAFWLIFIACYQRDLLRSLVFSFDFMFYSFQVSSPLFAGAWLMHWDINQCLWLSTNWIWSHWVFCLDALTPMMKAKLRFHVCYAVPVVLTQLIGGIKLLNELIMHVKYLPEDSVLWSGRIFGCEVKLHLLPFLVSRLLIATTWTFRLLLRLCRASNADGIIIRGVVSYRNYLSQSSPTRHRVTSRVTKRFLNHLLTQVNLKISPTISPEALHIPPHVKAGTEP